MLVLQYWRMSLLMFRVLIELVMLSLSMKLIDDWLLSY